MIRLAERLVELSPAPIEHVFFCDSGSVSVEVAIKLALQYQVARGNNGRTRMLTVRGGYHGDTFAPMSVCDPVNGMHSLFTGALKEQVFGPQPCGWIRSRGGRPGVPGLGCGDAAGGG